MSKLQEKLDEDAKVAINRGLCLLFASILVLLSNKNKISWETVICAATSVKLKVELEIMYNRNILPYNTLQ